jgi:hypothetical protein
VHQVAASSIGYDPTGGKHNTELTAGGVRIKSDCNRTQRKPEKPLPSGPLSAEPQGLLIQPLRLFRKNVDSDNILRTVEVGIMLQGLQMVLFAFPLTLSSCARAKGTEKMPYCGK